MQTHVKNFLFRVLCGFFLGISVVAPGVSGSIMAVMMGIYRDLINIISNPFKNFKHNFFYLLPMGIGALISLVLFVKIFAIAFETYPIQSRLLFMGLIAGGLIEVFQQVHKTTFKWHYLMGLIIAFGIALAVGFLGHPEATAYSENINIWYLCLAGTVSGIISMVPGMSISLILMLFGIYDYLLHTVSSFTSDFKAGMFVALPLGISFFIGMILFSKLIKFVFDRYPGFAYFLVFGFMCGTLFAVFPSTLPTTAAAWIISILLFFIGLFVSICFQFIGKKFNTSKSLENNTSE